MPNLADWTLLALVIALAVGMYEQAKQIAWLGERLREMEAMVGKALKDHGLLGGE